MRHSLSDESVCVATVLGSWCGFPDVIPHDDIIAAFQDKGKRPKDKGRDTGEAAEDTHNFEQTDFENLYIYP